MTVTTAEPKAWRPHNEEDKSGFDFIQQSVWTSLTHYTFTQNPLAIPNFPTYTLNIGIQ